MTDPHPTPEIQELGRLIDTGEADPDNAHWQGKVLLFMARRVRFMMERDTITAEQCAAYRRNCPGAKLFEAPMHTMGSELVKQVPWLILVAVLVSALLWIKSTIGG